MQRDCHYYATLALCKWAGYTDDESKLIAWANFQVDCTKQTQVTPPWINMVWNNPGPYFHFVSDEDSGIVEANSLIVRGLIERAETLIQLGIALHAFQDSYSHAGFFGKLDKRNVMGLGRGYWLFPPYGHTQLMKMPDRCEAVWTDTRTGEVRQNNVDFRVALRKCYELIQKPDSPASPPSDIIAVVRWPDYDDRKAEWARLAGFPDIRFSSIQADYWAKYGKEFKAAARLQKKILQNERIK